MSGNFDNVVGYEHITFSALNEGAKRSDVITSPATGFDEGSSGRARRAP